MGNSANAERNAEGIPKLYAFAANLGMGQLEQFTRGDLRNAQDMDDVTGMVKKFVNAKLSILSQYPQEVTLMKCESKKLRFKDGLCTQL